jgi:hypothetical protein
MPIEITLLDHRIGPEAVHKFFFEQDFSSTLDESAKQVKVLG